MAAVADFLWISAGSPGDNAHAPARRPPPPVAVFAMVVSFCDVVVVVARPSGAALLLPTRRTGDDAHPMMVVAAAAWYARHRCCRRPPPRPRLGERGRGRGQLAVHPLDCERPVLGCLAEPLRAQRVPDRVLHPPAHKLLWDGRAQADNRNADERGELHEGALDSVHLTDGAEGKLPSPHVWCGLKVAEDGRAQVPALFREAAVVEGDGHAHEDVHHAEEACGAVAGWVHAHQTGGC